MTNYHVELILKILEQLVIVNRQFVCGNVYAPIIIAALNCSGSFSTGVL